MFMAHDQNLIGKKVFSDLAQETKNTEEGLRPK